MKPSIHQLDIRKLLICLVALFVIGNKGLISQEVSSKLEHTPVQVKSIFMPIDSMASLRENCYPFLGKPTVFTTDELYIKTMEVDVYPRTEYLGGRPNFQWNKQAQVFTSTGDFKILSNEMEVLYEFSEHSTHEVLHLESKPIAILNGYYYVSFIDLANRQKIKSLSFKEGFKISEPKGDLFNISTTSNDSLFVHNFKGTNVIKIDTLLLSIPVSDHYKIKKDLHPDKEIFVHSSADSLMIEDLVNGGYSVIRFPYEIDDLKFLNDGKNILIGTGKDLNSTFSLYRFPSLELLREVDLSQGSLDFFSADHRLVISGFQGPLEIMNFDGGSLYNVKRESIDNDQIYNGPGTVGTGFYKDDFILFNVRTDKVREIKRIAPNSKRFEVVKKFHGEIIKVIGFNNHDNCLVYVFGDRLFYLDLIKNKITKVRNLDYHMNPYYVSMDPYSNRICFKQPYSGNEFNLVDLEKGKLRKLSAPVGKFFFTSNPDVLIGVSQASIYKLNIKSGEMEDLIDIGTKLPDLKHHRLSQDPIYHPTKDLFYFGLGNLLFKVDPINLEVRAYELEEKFELIGVKNDSMFYMNNDPNRLHLYNLNSGEYRKLEKTYYHDDSILKNKIFIKDNDGIGLSAKNTIFDPRFRNRYQNLGNFHRLFISCNLQFVASSRGDKLILYERAK